MAIELALRDSGQQARLMLRGRARITCMGMVAVRARWAGTIENEETGG